jgi:putative cell wall-binding protein
VHIPTRARLAGAAASLLLVVAAPAMPASAQWSDWDQVQDIVDELECFQRNESSACHHGLAQTVTVGVSGPLRDLTLPLNRSTYWTELDQPIVVEIRDGSPEGSTLAASEPVMVGDLAVAPDWDWVDFTFETPAVVTAGQVVAITFPDGPLDPPQESYLNWGKADSNVYGGGVAWGGAGTWSAWSDGSDFAFVTYIQLPLTRFAGPDRFATAAETAYGFRPGVPVAYIATGYNFPDALTGGPAAALEGGPVLLTRPDRLPDVVKDALEWLEPSQIRILGGTAVVSNAVLDELKAYTTGSVTRLAGANRYATAAAVLDARFAGYTGPVFVATGAKFPDALSGGAAAAVIGAPVILATANDIPDAIVGPLVGVGPYEGLTPTSFVLLGGTAVLGSGVINELKALFPGVPVSRWWGADRYATSAAISAQAFPGGADTVYLATGLNFPDALAGVPLVSRVEGPLLLTRQSCVPAVVATEIERLDPAQIVLLGGPLVVSDAAPTTVCD